jgi:hypothetical protein
MEKNRLYCAGLEWDEHRQGSRSGRVKALFALWFAVAVWVSSTTPSNRVPGAALRAASASDSRTPLVAKLPERIAGRLRVPQPVSVRDGTLPRALIAERAAVSLANARGPGGESILETAARDARPRRLTFTYEATAPPPALS